MTKLKSKLSKEEIDYIISKCMDGHAGNVMRQDQLLLGRRILDLGDEPWLSKDDWNPNIVISTDGNRVYIIALIAKVSGQGAFSRLVDGILDTGLCPVVVCPFASMRQILLKWNWRQNNQKSLLDDNSTEEQWFPQKEFKENRKKRKDAARNKAIYEQTMGGNGATTAFQVGYHYGLQNQGAGSGLLGSSATTQMLKPYFTILNTTI